MNVRSRQVLLSLLSGVLLAAAFPPLPSGPLAWVALVPLLFALDAADTRRAAGLGYVFGVAFHVCSLYWIAFHVDIPRLLSIAAWVAASLVLGVYYAAACACFRLTARWVGRRWVWFVPFIWVAVEYSRYVSEFAFPWTVIAHSQSRLLGLIQQADFWGVLGVSLWVVALNVLAFRAMQEVPVNARRATGFAATFALVVAASATYGTWRMSENPTVPARTRIALVQPNIGMDTKWDADEGIRATMDSMMHQTMQIPPGSADLVIWPETAIPDYVVYAPPFSLDSGRNINPRYVAYFDSLTRHLRAPILSGLPAQDFPRDAQFNSAALIIPGTSSVQYYDKTFLVPFGERVPYESAFGFLGKMNLGIARWSPSNRFSVFHSPAGNFGVGICFESVFPRVMSDFVRAGADFLVVVTNDAWFGKTSLIYQHAAFASFRAIENRVWVARCANTGISAFYDPWGRRVQEAGIFTRETLIGTIGPREKVTPYVLWGDWIVVIAGAVSLIGVAGGGMAAWKRARRRTS
ncbi:MAG TPA: apolipoprotein N-acyltransferase [Candidatus Latescibacteria bacterium]|nr:apolipoprotein N-acyltransferase [Candidatus Latescibacterota bacterium]